MTAPGLMSVWVIASCPLEMAQQPRGPETCRILGLKRRGASGWGAAGACQPRDGALRAGAQVFFGQIQILS